MRHRIERTIWDRWAIQAELKRLGRTPADLGAESGVSAASIRAALRRPSTRVNGFLAKVLKTPVHELWPDWFYPDGELIPAKHRQRLSRERGQRASPESQVVARAS